MYIYIYIKKYKSRDLFYRCSSIRIYFIRNLTSPCPIGIYSIGLYSKGIYSIRLHDIGALFYKDRLYRVYSIGNLISPHSIGIYFKGAPYYCDLYCKDSFYRDYV